MPKAIFFDLDGTLTCILRPLCLRCAGSVWP